MLVWAAATWRATSCCANGLHGWAWRCLSSGVENTLDPVSDSIATNSTLANRNNASGPMYGLRGPCRYKTVSAPEFGDLGRVADVSAKGNYAYLTMFYEPQCGRGGVQIVDISDPANPVKKGYIPSHVDTFSGEGSQVVTLECVGNTVAGEYIGTALWEGCSLRLLLEEAGVRSDPVDVVFRPADEYSDSISLIRAMAGDVMVAFKMNGVALPQSHEFPARAIVPGHYGMKSVQWLTGIEVVDHD